MFYTDNYGFEWNNELSEKIFERSTVGMAFISVQEGKFLRANETLCKMLDYSEWELLSKTWKEVTAGQDIKADSEGVRRLINKEKDHYFLRKKYITKGDEIIDTYLFVQSIFDKSGEIQYFLATITPCEIVIDKDEKMCPVSNDTSAPNPYLYSLKQNWVQFLLIVGSLIGLIYQYGQNQQKIENRISTLEKDFKAIVQKNEDVLEEIKQSLKNIKK